MVARETPRTSAASVGRRSSRGSASLLLSVMGFSCRSTSTQACPPSATLSLR